MQKPVSANYDLLTPVRPLFLFCFFSYPVIYPVCIAKSHGTLTHNAKKKKIQMSHSRRAELLRKGVDTALPVASILRTIHVIKATCVCRSTATREKKNWAFHCFHALQCFFSFLFFGCCLLLVCLLRLSGTLNHKRTHTHTRIRLRVHMYENIFGIFVNPLGRALHLP